MSISLDIYLITTLIASVTDMRSRRVPNVLTYAAAALIVVASGATGGPIAGALAALWLVISVVAGSFVFGRGWIGGGDIKLMAVGAAAIGYPSFIAVLMYIAIAGGFLAAAFAARRHRLRDTVLSVAISAATRTAVVPHPTSSRIPYALAICAGSFFYAVTESAAAWFPFAH